MPRNVHFSSERQDWETPQYLFDGLSQQWRGVCWINPPYGREIGRSMQTAIESAGNRGLVVCLVPVRTDTRLCQKYATCGEIRYLRGRLKFGNAKNSAPFPSAIVIFRSPRTGEIR